MRDAPPMVCICIPTYNAALTIRETLTSILAQTYSNLVVRISDNASTDATLSIIESMVDSRVTIHQQIENIGAEGNFNRCLRLAEGKYAAVFHADDIYEPNMVEKQVTFLESHPEAGAVFTEASMIDELGNLIGEICLPQSIVSRDGLYDFEKIFKAVLRYSNFFVCPSFMFRTQVCKDENISWRGDIFGSSADLDVWFSMMRHHPIGILPEKLIRYRISAGQWSLALRSRIARSDLFRVTDYYLAQEEVKKILAPHDWRHYGRLERTDRIVRATNLYLQGDTHAAEDLCRDIFTVDAFLAGLQDRRGLITMLVGVSLRTFIFLRLAVIGQPLLRRLKRYAGK